MSVLDDRRPLACTASRLRQRGISLVVSLIMLVVVLLLGVSAARIAIQSEKASRSDRDRQIAFQAAEAALMDAELDIEGSPSAEKGRSDMFSPDSRLGFPETGCGAGSDNPRLGLCASAAAEATPAWMTVDFSDVSDNASSVPFGRFTGYAFQTGKGSLPNRLPRYIIEQLVYSGPGQAADKPSYFYRITAVGFGAQASTQVALQTFYRKEAK